MVKRWVKDDGTGCVIACAEDDEDVLGWTAENVRPGRVVHVIEADDYRAYNVITHRLVAPLTS